ncbi:hypothetical protein COOONC_00301 [Cooperia oncophora]
MSMSLNNLVGTLPLVQDEFICYLVRGRFICFFCKSAFNSRSRLEEHLIRCLLGTYRPCELCNEFAPIIERFRHVMNVHKQNM